MYILCVFHAYQCRESDHPALFVWIGVEGDVGERASQSCQTSECHKKHSFAYFTTQRPFVQVPQEGGISVLQDAANSGLGNAVFWIMNCEILLQ